MRSENSPGGQGGRSFIERARRAQIIDAAVLVLAESGFAQASLARIAARAGISKGVISYHFAGKDELMEQIVEQVYTDIGETVTPQIVQETTPGGMLRRQVLAVAGYMRGHRDRLLALGEIFNNLRTSDGHHRYGPATNEPLYRLLEERYREGQRSGEFRDFDVRVMAVTQQSAIDAMFAYWAVNPDRDLDAYARELADLFERAVRACPPRPGSDDR